jgi:hypothetical protein
MNQPNAAPVFASATLPGWVSTGAQTFAGNKTFSGYVEADHGLFSRSATGALSIGSAGAEYFGIPAGTNQVDFSAAAVSLDSACTINSQAHDISDSWHVVGSGGGEPAFQNSWTADTGGGFVVRFKKDALGFLHLEGVAFTPGSSTTGTIFTLPVGYRPVQKQLLSYTLGSISGALIEIRTNGDVYVTYSSLGTGYDLDLNCVFGLD